MTASYSMGSRLVWADLGSAAITRELLQAYGKPNPGRTWMIERIVNVEKDPTYQEKDIDLVVHSRHVVDGTCREGHVEIKCDSYPAGDLYGKTNQGNFFWNLSATIQNIHVRQDVFCIPKLSFCIIFLLQRVPFT